jgi:hypothetical protein
VVDGGTLVLDTGAVVKNNAGTGVTVNGGKRDVEMRDGTSVMNNTGGTNEVMY